MSSLWEENQYLNSSLNLPSQGETWSSLHLTPSAIEELSLGLHWWAGEQMPGSAVASVGTCPEQRSQDTRVYSLERGDPEPGWERVPLRKVRGQGRCHPPSPTPLLATGWSHRVRYSPPPVCERSPGLRARIQPQPASRTRALSLLWAAPAAGAASGGFSVQLRAAGLELGHFPLPSSTSATSSPTPTAGGGGEWSEGPRESLSDSLLTHPPGSSQRCGNRTSFSSALWT